MFTLDKSMDKISKTYPIEILKSFLELTQKYEEFEFIFTDASKTKDNVGCALIYEEDQQLYNLPEQCSIFFGEAIAILKALSYIQLYCKKCIIVKMYTLYSRFRKEPLGCCHGFMERPNRHRQSFTIEFLDKRNYQCLARNKNQRCDSCIHVGPSSLWYCRQRKSRPCRPHS